MKLTSSLGKMKFKARKNWGGKKDLSRDVGEVSREGEVAVDGDDWVEEGGLIAVKDARLQIKLAKVIQIRKSRRKRVIQMRASADLVDKAHRPTKQIVNSSKVDGHTPARARGLTNKNHKDEKNG